MKILFVMLNPDYMRNFEPALRLLTQKEHQIYIGFNNFKDRDNGEIRESLVRENDNINYIPGLLPNYKKMFTLSARTLRTLRDYLRYLSPRYKDAFKLRKRMEKRLWIFKFILVPFFKFLRLLTGDKGLKLTDKYLAAMEKYIPADEGICSLIKSINPDIMLISPLIDFESVQDDYVKSAHFLGIPVGLCVHSWDNLTNRGLIKVDVERVFLWNNVQKKEAIELHGIDESKIIVTGAQCYDKWFKQKPSITKDEFCRKAGLPVDKPCILYLCSSNFIAPDEVNFVKDWVKTLRGSDKGELKEISILIRPHFQNAQQWENADLSEYENVIIWPRLGENPVTEESRANFYNSIYHSVAVVGLNTSAMIEAGILSKPVFTILDSRFKGTQEGTLHFHYLIKGGLLYISNNFQEHLQQLNTILGGKDNSYQERIRNFVKDFVRPNGIDKECTPMLVNAIEELAKIKPPKPQHPPLWTPLVRLLLWPGAWGVKYLMKRIEMKKRLIKNATQTKKWTEFFEETDRNIFKQSIHARRLIEIILENTPKGGKILEAGCGTATLSLVLADCGFNVTALDIDKEVLDYARKRTVISNTLKFVQGDILSLSSLFKEGEFDVVCHSGVMEHFSDKDSVKSLAEQRKVSKRVIFMVPNNHNRLTEKHFGNERFLSNRQWVDLIKKAGFETVRIFGSSDLLRFTYFILPGVFFYHKASFWWRYLSRHSIFVCE